MFSILAPSGGLEPVVFRTVVQVVNLEFYVCLSPGFEPQVGGAFDFIFAKIKIERIQ